MSEIWGGWFVTAKNRKKEIVMFTVLFYDVFIPSKK